MDRWAVKYQVGEWTGDTSAEAEGAAQQIKGNVEKALGNVKDAVRGTARDVGRDADRDTIDDDDLDRESVRKVERGRLDVS